MLICLKFILTLLCNGSYTEHNVNIESEKQRRQGWTACLRSISIYVGYFQVSFVAN